MVCSSTLGTCETVVERYDFPLQSPKKVVISLTAKPIIHEEKAKAEEMKRISDRSNRSSLVEE